MANLSIPTQNLATAEAAAINAFGAFLSTPEGQAAGEEDLKLWVTERGWPPSKLRIWTESVSAALALAQPERGDPRFVAARLDHRLERIAHRAEDQNDLKHAIEATVAQAKLNRAGGFSAGDGSNLTINVTNATAHLASDDQLARIATNADVLAVRDEEVPPEQDEMLQ